MARSQFHFHNHNVRSESYVTEKRAPTDESVRLLKEMESEAKQKIVDSITVNNTEFECNIQSEIDGLNDKTTYCVTYRMNGKKNRLYVDIPNWKRPTDVEVMIKVRDELAKDIASNMIDGVLRNAETRRVFIDKFKSVS
jgi:hypothetical protein